MENVRIGVGGDHLPLKEIARAWSKVTRDDPAMLMGGLVSAFWRGEFEGDAQSALFTLLKPDSASFDSVSFEPRAGNYAIREGGVVVKVGEDLDSYITDERKRAPVFREGVAYMHCRPEWRGITPEHPVGFSKWTDEERDESRPNWRTEFDEGFRGLSTIPFEQWSTDMREDHYSQWCIRRHDFARWYCASTLSAGAELEDFWPRGAGKKPPLFQSAPATVKAGTECRRWLEGIMKASPDKRLKTKDPLFAVACAKFGRLSRRGFDEAWKAAAEKVGAHAWVKGGAPKKSPQ